MPAVTVENPLVLPRITRPDEATVAARPVDRVVTAHHAVEGAGFEVWRPFPGGVDLHLTDPFLLLDQLGPVEYAPGEAKGAPWHPHRGFETVTYVLDGEITHHDSNGGGGTIAEEVNFRFISQSGLLVYLSIPPDQLLLRLRRKTNRPLLGGDGTARLDEPELRSRVAELHKIREPYYRMADVVVETGTQPVGLTVDTIVRKLLPLIS